MIEFQLNIGEVAASAGRANYVCYGLGSCVALFVHDRLTGHSGGAHIFLPGNEMGPTEPNKFFNVESAVTEVLRRLTQLGNNRETLRAAIVGGGNILNDRANIGRRNVESLRKELVARKIFVASADVGGKFCRSVRFQGHTGNLSVRSSLYKPS